MIFDAKYARQIAAGKATVLRIPAHKGKVGTPYAPIAWRLAHDYPIRTGAGKDPLCHVRVMGIEREALAPTLRQARASGFRTTDAYKIWWVGTFDRAFLCSELAHLIPSDPLTVGLDQATIDAAMLERFQHLWYGRTVWVITLALSSDTPRFLAQQRGRARGDGQYVPSPSQAIDEAECIEPERQEKYAAAARAISAQRRSSLKRDLDDERLRRRRARLELFRTVA